MPLGRLDFRPFTRDDLPLLARWLATPHVAAWWREPADLPSVARRYASHLDGTDPTLLFVITEDDRPVGFIQCYRHADDPDWDRAVGIPDAAGIDYLIGEPDRIGRGLGSRAIAAFSTTVFDRYPDVQVIVAAPQADNVASCRALVKAGYTLAGVRDLESDDPGDAGPSAIHVLARRRHRASPPVTGHINSSGRPDPVTAKGHVMAAISREEVAHLARLARLAVDDTELDTFAGQLDVILQSVARVGEVAADDIPPTSHSVPLTNVLRDDVEVPCLSREEALSGAPDAAEGRFRVPRILDEEA